MADNTVVHIGENSPEQVALKLLEKVAAVEGKAFHRNPTEATTADREWILSTYAQCLDTIRRAHYDTKKR